MASFLRRLPFFPFFVLASSLGASAFLPDSASVIPPESAAVVIAAAMLAIGSESCVGAFCFSVGCSVAIAGAGGSLSAVPVLADEESCFAMEAEESVTSSRPVLLVRCRDVVSSNRSGDAQLVSSASRASPSGPVSARSSESGWASVLTVVGAAAFDEATPLSCEWGTSAPAESSRGGISAAGCSSSGAEAGCSEVAHDSAAGVNDEAGEVRSGGDGTAGGVKSPSWWCEDGLEAAAAASASGEKRSVGGAVFREGGGWGVGTLTPDGRAGGSIAKEAGAPGTASAMGEAAAGWEATASRILLRR